MTICEMTLRENVFLKRYFGEPPLRGTTRSQA